MAINWERVWDLVVIIYCSLAVGIAFGLPLPSMEDFIEAPSKDGPGGGLGLSETVYSLAIAAFNVGDVVGSVTSGLLNRHLSVRGTFALGSVAGVIGGVLYALAGVASGTAWLAIFGRFMQGIWSGVANSMIRVFLVNTYSGEDLIPMMSFVGFVVAIMMAGSPALDGLLSMLPVVGTSVLWVDQYRASGWLLSVIALIGVVLVLTVLSNKDDATQNAAESTTDNNKNGSNTTWMWDTNGVNRWLIFVLMAAFFVSSFGFTALETMATPLMTDQFGFPEVRISVVYLIIGGLSALCCGLLFLITKRKWISEKQQCLGSLLCLAGGFYLVSDWQFGSDSCHQWDCSYDETQVCSANLTSIPCQASPGCVWNQNGLYGDCDVCPPVCHDPHRTLGVNEFFSGFFFVNLAFIVGRLMSGGLYAKLLGRTPSTRFMQGLLNGTGSCARVIGPPIAVALYELASHRTYGVMLFFGTLSLITAAPFIWLWNDRAWNRVDAENEEMKEGLLRKDFRRSINEEV